MPVDLKGADELKEHIVTQEVPDSPFKHDIMKGQTVLITGGASGLGLEMARDFARHGANLIIMGRRQNFLDDAVEEIKKAFPGVVVDSFSGDVRSEESAKGAIAKAVAVGGGLDVLVNSAAGNFLSTAEMYAFKHFLKISS